MSIWQDLLGTTSSIFGLGKTGPKIKNNSSIVEFRNNADSAYAPIVASSINKMAIIEPETSSTLTVADGKIATISNTLTFTGTDSSVVALGTGGTVLYNAGALGTPSSGNLANCTGVTAVNGPAIVVTNNVTDIVNDIDFSAGFFPFSDSTGGAVLAAMVKRLDATWAAGTNQGGLFSGSKANSTTYHLFAIYKASDGSTDCGFDTSVTAANIPSGYTKYKRVASLYTNSSGNWVVFQQIGKYVNLKVQSTARAYATASNTTANLQTLAVPSGIQIAANVTGVVNGSSGTYFNLQNPYETDVTPTIDICVAAGAPGAAYQTTVVTNTSAQIVTRATSTGLSFGVTLRGWTDLTN